MSIEPISTGMTYQAVSTPQAKPVEQVAQDNTEKMVITEQQAQVEPKIKETQGAAEDGAGMADRVRTPRESRRSRI